MTSREFFVLDENNHASLDNHFSAEAFTTEKRALIRARQLAKSDHPGHTFVVAEAIAYVTSEISPPTVTFRERKLKRKANGSRRKAARSEQASR